jgi:hypothetical protein
MALKVLVSFALVSTAAAFSCKSKDCAAGLDEISLMQVKQHVSQRQAAGAPPASLLEQNTAASAGTEVQQHLRSGLELSRKFLKASEQVKDVSTRSLFKMFAVCGQCNKFERWGEPHDGGYLMCLDSLHRGDIRSAYSMGVEQHDQWSEDAFAKLGVNVNQFDCTVESSACTHCNFHKKCIVAADGKHPVPGHESEGWSLLEALKKTGQADAPDGSLLMKMDIESSEWPLLAQEPSDSLRKFGQLVMEFHRLHDYAAHPLYLQAMQTIVSSGLNVVHVHGNNHEANITVGDTVFPRVIEVTFARGSTRPGKCLTDQDYNVLLDAPNWKGVKEMPMMHIGNFDDTVLASDGAFGPSPTELHDLAQGIDHVDNFPVTGANLIEQWNKQANRPLWKADGVDWAFLWESEPAEKVELAKSSEPEEEYRGLYSQVVADKDRM